VHTDNPARTDVPDSRRSPTAVPPCADQSERCIAINRAADVRRAPASSSGPPTPPNAGLVTHWPTPSLVVVAAYGAIDATTARVTTDYVLSQAMCGCGLILDLRAVNFFGTEGFLALHRMAVGCAHTGTAWSLVPGPAVTRLLRICDPQCLLPAADSVDSALTTVTDQIALHRSPSRAAGIRTRRDWPTPVAG
jgi:anti-anti-sigma regulatory factor